MPKQVDIYRRLGSGTSHALENLTADGYYTSRIGLMQELEYNGDAVLAAFPPSTIPEH